MSGEARVRGLFVVMDGHVLLGCRGPTRGFGLSPADGGSLAFEARYQPRYRLEMASWQDE